MKDITESQIYDFRQLWGKFRWGITPDIQRELDHHKIFDFFPLSDAYIIPATNSEIEHNINQFPTLSHFDRADQSIITAAIRENGIILTDDGDLLIECITLGIHAMSLPVFCLDLVKNSELSKRECYHLLIFWETHHRYAKKDLKRWKTQLQSL
jgi:predicted nuclease of predicted toxin-antitoxin system